MLQIIQTAVQTFPEDGRYITVTVFGSVYQPPSPLHPAHSTHHGGTVSGLTLRSRDLVRVALPYCCILGHYITLLRDRIHPTTYKKFLL
ncbi:hypothetical protein J6590_036645 [Homalodisca vitripennis]|nr:hypothetical protein J6590_036645 [Homalodisca vitripennis]